MSHLCPLCGKNKPDQALFCDDCSKKIRTEYEINVPEMKKGGESKTSDPVPVSGGKLRPDVPSGISRPENTSGKTSPENTLFTKKQPKNKVGKVALGVILVGIFLVMGFFFYGQRVRENNLERIKWDAAMKENTVDGYLTYITEFPKGIHYDQAQQNLLNLKSEEASAWERMRTSDNTAELRDFIRQHPESPYNSLIRTRLDSITWMGALKTNTAEAYSDYMMLSQSGDFNGDYFAEAQKRYEMLFQSYPVNAGELDSIQIALDGFYRALSAVDYNAMIPYLAPMINRFFGSGAAARERITGELLVAGAKAQESTIKFSLDLESVQYEKTLNDHYNVNVPLVKSYEKDGKTEDVSGYIVHVELDPMFQIVSIYETKPSVNAP